MARQFPDAGGIQLLVNHFPAVFAVAPVAVLEEGEAMLLTGYFQAGESNVHAHYIAPDERIPAIHEHKGGRRVHDHCPAKGA